MIKRFDFVKIVLTVVFEQHMSSMVKKTHTTLNPNLSPFVFPPLFTDCIGEREARM